MQRLFKAWFRFTVILALCLAGAMLFGAHLVRAVAAEPAPAAQDDAKPAKEWRNPDAAQNAQESLPTVALEDDSLAALDDPKGAVFQWLDGVTTLEAKFVQQGPDGAIAHGKMYLARPGKARFEYEPTVPILIVAKDDVLRFIDYEVGQVTPIPIKETPLALLLEPEAKLRQRLEVTEAGPGPVAGTIAVTARDPEHPEYGRLTLIFTQGGGAEAQSGRTHLSLRGWEVLDGQGQITRVKLENVQTNIALANNVFDFEDPRRGGAHRGRRPG